MLLYRMIMKKRKNWLLLRCVQRDLQGWASVDLVYYCPHNVNLLIYKYASHIRIGFVRHPGALLCVDTTRTGQPRQRDPSQGAQKKNIFTRGLLPSRLPTKRAPPTQADNTEPHLSLLVADEGSRSNLNGATSAKLVSRDLCGGGLLQDILRARLL